MPSDYLFAGEGYIGAAGEFDSDLGAERELEDYDPAGTGSLLTKRSACRRRGKWVKNDSTVTLTRGQAVKYKATFHGLRIGAVCGAGDIPDGVVDDYIVTAGVLDGQNFWLILSGPNQLVTDGAGALAQGDILVTVAGGKVKKQVATQADGTGALTQANSVVGRCTVTVAATVDLKFLAYIKRAHY